MIALVPVQIQIAELAHGGDGVGRDPEGRVYFVPFTAPGDVAMVEPDPRRRERARLLEVVTPGLGRAAPPCPLFGRCGGCQWQHVSLVAQRAAKSATVGALLSRALGREVALDPIWEGPGLEYRRRARLRALSRSGGFGFAERRGDGQEPVDRCLLLAPPAQELWDTLRPALAGVPAESVGLLVGEEGAAFHLELRDRKGLTRVPAVRGARGSIATAPGGERRVQGDPVLSEPAPMAPGVRLRHRPDLFAQAQRGGAEAMVAEVIAQAGDALGGATLELYSGAGLFTFALCARSERVLAVEGEEGSLALARASADEAGVKNVRFYAADAAVAARALATEGSRQELVVLDPPRAGARETLPHLARLAPRRIVYVSCDPATLARDAADLAALGYILERARPFDLFPQTYHVEVVATFGRGPGPSRQA